MAPFKIPAIPETRHLLDAQREREQQRADLLAQQDTADVASQASTVDISDHDDNEDNDDNNNECIAFDTIEAYTANVQNKKRIFADEILRV
jgi:hypothetical protein